MPAQAYKPVCHNTCTDISTIPQQKNFLLKARDKLNISDLRSLFFPYL